jgi:hypothetical protein
MAVTRIDRRPMITTRRVARRKTRRFQRATRRSARSAARPLRRVSPTSRLQTILAALRALWERTGRALTSRFTAHAVAGLAGLVGLVIDCFALHAVLIA